MVLVLCIGKEAAFTHLGRASRDIRFLGAPDIGLIQFLAFIAGDIDLRSGPKGIWKQIGAHMSDRWTALGDGDRILVGKRFAAHFLVGYGAQEWKFEDHGR